MISVQNLLLILKVININNKLKHYDQCQELATDTEGNICIYIKTYMWLLYVRIY